MSVHARRAAEGVYPRYRRASCTDARLLRRNILSKKKKAFLSGRLVRLTRRQIFFRDSFRYCLCCSSCFCFCFCNSNSGFVFKNNRLFSGLILLLGRLFSKLFRLYIGCIVGIIPTRTSRFRSERCIGGTLKMKILYHKCSQKSIKIYEEEHFSHAICRGG